MQTSTFRSPWAVGTALSLPACAIARPEPTEEAAGCFGKSLRLPEERTRSPYLRRMVEALPFLPFGGKGEIAAVGLRGGFRTLTDAPP